MIDKKKDTTNQIAKVPRSDSAEDLYLYAIELEWESKPDQICRQLESLLLLVQKIKRRGSDWSVIETKIETGIFQLEKMNAAAECAYYKKILQRIRKSELSFSKTETLWIIVSLVGLTLIALYGSKILENYISMLKNLFKNP